jgi:hypothetical protein
MEYIGQRGSVGIVEEDIFCASLSISRNQWDEAERAIDRIKENIPGLTIEISKGFKWHNGGYSYKEVRIAHRYAGRAFEAQDYIAEAISDIPLRG